MRIEIPEPDSQFKLLPCRCGGQNVGYQSTITGGKKEHRAKCPDCGQRTPWFQCRHDAQVDWNGRFWKRDW